jgi:4-hydroxy-tetrahydrodipicolinate synthase
MMKRLDGVNCLLMTPFTKQGDVDHDGLRREIDHVIDGGVTSLVAMGKIGEFGVLTMEERRSVMSAVVEHVAGRVPVGFGIINAGFDEGLTLGRYAAEARGDFVMSRPPVEGDVMDYFMRLTDLIPVMPYDLGEQGELFVDEHIVPLVEKTGNIVGLKISGMPDKVPEAKRLLDIPVLCGWDLMSLLEYQMGSDGVISGSAALIPRDEVELYQLAKQGRWDEARDIYYGKLVPLLNYCTFDPHAYSVSKYALYYQGVIDCSDVRAPNPDAGAARAKEVREVLSRIGAISSVPA